MTTAGTRGDRILLGRVLAAVELLGHRWSSGHLRRRRIRRPGRRYCCFTLTAKDVDDDRPEVCHFPGVVGAGMVWIPLRDPEDDTWWVMSADGVSYWDGPDQIREHADGLVAEGIDEIEPGIADSYRMLADLIERIASGEQTP